MTQPRLSAPPTPLPLEHQVVVDALRTQLRQAFACLATEAAGAPPPTHVIRRLYGELSSTWRRVGDALATRAYHAERAAYETETTHCAVSGEHLAICRCDRHRESGAA